MLEYFGHIMIDYEKRYYVLLIQSIHFDLEINEMYTK